MVHFFGGLLVEVNIFLIIEANIDIRIKRNKYRLTANYILFGDYVYLFFLYLFNKKIK